MIAIFESITVATQIYDRCMTAGRSPSKGQRSADPGCGKLEIEGTATNSPPSPRGPTASSAQVRANMRRQKRRDTGCEMAVRRLLHSAGVRYRVDFRPFQDQRFRADIGWKGRKLAVFIDGCFWHGCPIHGNIPKSNAAWWIEKFRANADRDRRTDETLRLRGWAVLRFWEHEPPEEVAATILERLRSEGLEMSARRRSARPKLVPGLSDLVED